MGYHLNRGETMLRKNSDFTLKKSISIIYFVIGVLKFCVCALVLLLVKGFHVNRSKL